MKIFKQIGCFLFVFFFFSVNKVQADVKHIDVDQQQAFTKSVPKMTMYGMLEFFNMNTQSILQCDYNKGEQNKKLHCMVIPCDMSTANPAQLQ